MKIDFGFTRWKDVVVERKVEKLEKDLWTFTVKPHNKTSPVPDDLSLDRSSRLISDRSISSRQWTWPCSETCCVWSCPDSRSTSTTCRKQPTETPEVQIQDMSSSLKVILHLFTFTRWKKCVTRLSVCFSQAVTSRRSPTSSRCSGSSPCSPPACRPPPCSRSGTRSSSRARRCCSASPSPSGRDWESTSGPAA